MDLVRDVLDVEAVSLLSLRHCGGICRARCWVWCRWSLSSLSKLDSDVQWASGPMGLAMVVCADLTAA